MTEQYLIDIAFNGQMAELNLLPPNNHSTFIQKILKLPKATRKLHAKRADLPGVLAAKMSEPYDTPLHPRTDWPLIVQLIGRYASWYCKQQQNQNEGAPTTREQRIAQMDAERQAKKKRSTNVLSRSTGNATVKSSIKCAPSRTKLSASSAARSYSYCKSK